MDSLLSKATEKDKVAIEHLMQLYMYDFTEYLDYDVDREGLFSPYPELDRYWMDPDKFPYVIRANDKYAGFALIKSISTAARQYFTVAEYFVLRKYRRAGVGKSAAFQLFSLHRGNWQVHQRLNNTAAQDFWIKVIDAHTHSRFTDQVEEDRRVQRFET